MKTQNLGFIGGGRITKIFLQAFKNKSVGFKSIVVYDPNTETQNALKKQFPEIQIVDSVTLPAKQELVILAVHPPMMMETLNSIKDVIAKDALILSLSPKITIAKMSATISVSSVIRMIPNATSFINEGYNPVSFHSSISKNDKQLFIDTFKVLGNTFEVEETKLEAYAIVSAMLPTYFWFQWKELQDIGVRMGLDEKECKETMKETLKVSIEIFYNSGLSSDEVIDLIPVKPIGETESQVKEIYQSKLMGLFAKIKP